MKNMPSPSERESEVQSHIAAIGKLIRSTRLGLGYSVDDLASRSEVSTGLISQVERGIGNPSFLTLWKLSEALGLSYGSLVHRPSGSDPAVVRAGSRPRLELHEGLVYELLTPPTADLLSVNRTMIPPGFDNRERPFAHAGQECVHVLEGAISIALVGEVVRLEAGDSLTFEASIAHSYINDGPSNAVVIVSSSPANT